jgi:hypothetical protein
MTDLDRRATQVADGLRATLDRLSSLILVVAALAATIGVATFATGWWVFDRSHATWTVIGGAICLVPVVAALRGWWYVRATARVAPRLVDDVRGFLGESRQAAGVLIDHDSGQALAVSARSFGSLRAELNERRRDFPALYAGVRAITGVPGLAAIAVLGMLAAGALGTILLIGGLID